MADNKKSFVLYTDQWELFKKLPNETAGELIKHIFAYVNDEQPETDNLLIQIAFEPIKAQLKRDLKRWEEKLEARSRAGKASAESKKINKSQQTSTNSTYVDFVQQTSTQSTDNVNVNVNVNDNVNVTVTENDNKTMCVPEKKPHTPKPLKSHTDFDRNKYTEEQATRYDLFNQYIDEKCPNLRKVKKQITIDTFLEFTAEPKMKAVFLKCLNDMDNKPKFLEGKDRYTDLNKAIRNWVHNEILRQSK